MKREITEKNRAWIYNVFLNFPNESEIYLLLTKDFKKIKISLFSF